MIKQYKYRVEGTGREGHTWETSGTLEAEASLVTQVVMEASFRMLTNGRAVYGQPGSCRGPYDVHLIHIEQVKQ